MQLAMSLQQADRVPMQNAFRRGPWKFVRPARGKPMLFNLEEDPAEKNDLAERYPEKLKELMSAHTAVSASLCKEPGAL